MNWLKRNWLALACCSIVGGLWAIPLTRAFEFKHHVYQVFEEIGSLDALRDVDYAKHLVVLYLTGAVTTELLTLMLIKTKYPTLLPHVCIALTSLALLIAEAPESVIVLVPPLLINPLILTGLYLFLLLGGVALALGAKLCEHINRKYPVYGLPE